MKTFEELNLEYGKCAKDPIYFIRSYCHIPNSTQGSMLFDLYDFQEDAIEEFNYYRYNIILKPREMGITILLAAYALHKAIFNGGENILYMSPNTASSVGFITHISRMYDNLPDLFRLRTVEDNKMSIAFSNNSRIRATAATGDAGRSESTSLVIIEEAAFIKDISSIWSAIRMSIRPNYGKCIISSTPLKKDDWFHTVWNEAMLGHIFNPIKLHWSMIPGRRFKFKKEIRTLVGNLSFASDVEGEFI